VSILHPPTTITHSVCCPFISPNYKTLILATPHSISLYNVNNDISYLEEECNATIYEKDAILQQDSQRKDKNQNTISNGDAKNTSTDNKQQSPSKKKDTTVVSEDGL